MSMVLFIHVLLIHLLDGLCYTTHETKFYKIVRMESDFKKQVEKRLIFFRSLGGLPLMRWNDQLEANLFDAYSKVQRDEVECFDDVKRPESYGIKVEGGSAATAFFGPDSLDTLLKNLTWSVFYNGGFLVEMNMNSERRFDKNFRLQPDSAGFEATAFSVLTDKPSSIACLSYRCMTSNENEWYNVCSFPASTQQNIKKSVFTKRNFLLFCQSIPNCMHIDDVNLQTECQDQNKMQLEGGTKAARCEPKAYDPDFKVPNTAGNGSGNQIFNGSGNGDRDQVNDENRVMVDSSKSSGPYINIISSLASLPRL